MVLFSGASVLTTLFTAFAQAASPSIGSGQLTLPPPIVIDLTPSPFAQGLDFLLSFANVAVILATLLVIRRQYYAMQAALEQSGAALEHAKQTSRWELRAYVGVIPTGAVFPFTVNSTKNGLGITITNFGKTPALDVTVDGQVVLAQGDAEVANYLALTPLAKGTLPRVVLFPSASIQHTVDMGAELVDACFEGKGVYLRATVEYRDLLTNEVRRTDMLARVSHPDRETRFPKLTITSTGNSMS